MMPFLSLHKLNANCYLHKLTLHKLNAQGLQHVSAEKNLKVVHDFVMNAKAAGAVYDSNNIHICYLPAARSG